MLGIDSSIGAVVSAMILAGVCIALFVHSGRRLTWPEIPPQHAALLLAPVVLPVLLQLVGAWLKPEASVDGLLYHGPALANIIEQNSLFGWEGANQYLYFSDLQMVLAALWVHVSGAVRLEDAVQAPYFGLAVLALYVASSATARNRTLRMWMGLLVVITPVMWTQGRVLYVDVASAALFITGVALTTAALRWRTIWLFWVGSAAVGASVATKPSALFAGMACFALMLALMIGSRRWVTPIVGLLAFLVTSVPFYLRNLISFENPFFPIATGLGPLHFPGLVDGGTFTPSDGSGSLIDPARLVTFAQNVAVGLVSGTPRWLYDPREGGFDRTPALLVGAILISAIILTLTSRKGDARFTSVDGAWWLLPGSALLAVMVQPNPSDSRYVIGAYLCICAALIGLLSIAPEHSKTGLLLTVPLGGVIALLLFTTEQRMLFGIPESLRLRAADPLYNTGLNGATVAYGDRFAWLPDDACSRVVVQTHGGLGPTGMPSEGLLATYSYGLWGDHLCNEVRFVPTPDLEETESVLAVPSVQREIRTADFIVLKTESADAWRKMIREEGRTEQEVARFESTEYFPVSESVWHLS